MSNESKTPLSSKCDILADLWIQYKGDENFADFMQYNDLGLPLAYAISNDIIKASERATLFVEETFATLMYALADDSEDNITWTDDDGNDEPEAWMAQEFETLEDVFLFFGTDRAK